MNCKEARRQILLAETHESPAGGDEALRRHLEGCADCAEYGKSLRRIAALAGEALPQGEPSPAVVARIRSEAEGRHVARTLLFQPRWMQALAYAAVVAVAVTAWFARTPQTRIDRIDEVDALIAVIMEEEDDRDEVEPDRAETERLRALAERLLQMEGLAPAENFDEALFGGLSPEPNVESEPTALQWRSTTASDPRRCV
jgi:hypothetical protein